MSNSFHKNTAVFAFGAVVLTGIATAANAATSATQTTPPSILAFNQKLESGNILVEYAYLPEKGYAVVYGADKNGDPIREALGKLELAAGDHRKFKVKLEKTPAAGTSIWVTLYTDKDGKPGFDRTGDTAVWNEKVPAINQIIVQ